MATGTAIGGANGSASRTPSYDVVVVGAGIAGLYTLYRLRELGYSVRLLEAGSDVGGTWYWNRYPGARIDTESVEYSYTFSEDLQQEWSWTERYASQSELLKYVQHVARRFDLLSSISLNTRVTSAHFEEETNVWQIGTNTDQHLTAQFLVMATGFLSQPNIPAFKGVERFGGKTYHTGRWPHEPVDFTGLRVGVIGTGSSGVQSIPIIAQQASQLFVFQRTPPWSVPLRNGPINEEFVRFVKANYPEWRRRQRDAVGGFISMNFTASVPETRSALEVSEQERVFDYEERWRSGGLSLYNTFPDVYTNREANDTLAAFVAQKIREKVIDQALAEKLIPKFPILTKRLCADTNYYETYNRDNVTLVDVRESAIAEVTENGIVLEDGRSFELDALVFATGYDAVTGSMTGVDLVGRGGLSLSEHWANGPRTSVGLMSSGFPNMFIMDGPGSPGAFFAPILLSEYQAQWIGECIDYMRQAKIAAIDPRPEAEERWTSHVNEIFSGALHSTVDSWYRGANIPGKPKTSLCYLGGFKQYKVWCNSSAADDYHDFILTPEMSAGRSDAEARELVS